MRLLDFVVGTPVSQTLGWTLLHSLWEGAGIAAIVATVLALTRAPRVRYMAACISLLALLCGFGFTLIRLLPESYYEPQSSIHVTLPVWRDRSQVNLEASPVLRSAELIGWLAPVWACGVCLFYCWYAAGWLFSYRLRSRGLSTAPAPWQRTRIRLASGLKISRPVVLLESFFAEMPMVIGHFRPVILVPLGFLTGLSTDQVEAILLHELAHISRSDYLVNICQCLTEGLLFYHPAVWWISSIIREERENCCDDVVIAERGNVHAYAAALAELETNRFERSSSTRAAVVAGGGNLTKRIRRLLYPKAHRPVWAPAIAAVAFMISSGILFAAWSLVPTPYPAPQTSRNRVTTAWRKWLNEEVAYIISDEKAAFQRLRSDRERQHFVDEFWARRDPTPGTPENEFREEHYRRIAFANKMFGARSGRPGWQTDRGHI